MSRMGSISAAGDLSSLFGTSGAEGPAATGPMGDSVDAVVDAALGESGGEKSEAKEPAAEGSEETEATEGEAA